ncbi:MAG: MBL fold metallo-hydrolase [Spirochaetaceae bacterium]|jgi:phosphoribosyl 1,2-cyclic phosphate phosphodiesterase|nr:MBL fold metallo-hydrolase [Spirochaetaceae bacterium]
MKITILGSGTSHGVPVIGCSCPVCRSPDSRDKRTRCSLLVRGNGGDQAVIDTGPEFRIQALRARISSLDAVFLTHAHADHLHGLDDIRPLSRERAVPIYGNKETLDEFALRFSYIFGQTQQGGGKPRIETIAAEQPVQVGGLCFTPLPVKHGMLDILGWMGFEPRRGKGAKFVYITDCTSIGQDSLDRIAEGGPPDLFIIGALRIRSHGTHFNFEQALSVAARTGARRIFLTHICHDHFHREIEQYCRDFLRVQNILAEMGPAWDGMEIDL